MDAARSAMSASPWHLDASMHPRVVDPGGYDAVLRANANGT